VQIALYLAVATFNKESIFERIE